MVARTIRRLLGRRPTRNPHGDLGNTRPPQGWDGDKHQEGIINNQPLSRIRPPAVLIAIILAALLLRGIYLYQIAPTPLARFLAADTGNFDEFARQILAGNFFHPESIYFNPLYPFFLALIYRVFGSHPLAAMAVQALLDAAVCLLLYGISVRALKSRTTGLIAAFIYSAYGLAIFYTGLLLGTTAAAFLFTLTAFLLLPGGGKNRAGKFLAGGAVCGLCCLLRPNALFALPAIVFWLLVAGAAKTRTNVRKILRLVPFSLGFFLVLLPFSLRHYRITGEASLPFGNGGFNFYVGNHPGAKGTYTYLDGISHSPAEQIKSSIRRAETLTKREFGLREASGYWSGKAREFIRERPGEFITGLGRKFILFWNRREIGQNVDYQFSRRFAPLLRFPLFSFGLVAPFALLGLYYLVKSRPSGAALPALMLLSYLASVVLFFVSDRYRLVAVPLVVLFAAFGFHSLLRRLFEAIRARERIPILPPAILAGAVLLVHLPPAPVEEARYQAWSRTMLGNVYLEDGNPQGAIEEYRRALELNPNDPAALTQLGNAWWKWGDLPAAEEVFRLVLRSAGEDIAGHNNLGAVLAEQGKVEEAAREFETALQLDPHAPEAHSNLAVYYLYYRGDPARAAEHGRRARELGYQLPERLERDLGNGE